MQENTLKRPISQLELFDRTHKKENDLGEYIDKKSKIVSVSLFVINLHVIFNFFKHLISNLLNEFLQEKIQQDMQEQMKKREMELQEKMEKREEELKAELRSQMQGLLAELINLREKQI